jgi:hypothetical protein
MGFPYCLFLFFFSFFVSIIQYNSSIVYFITCNRGNVIIYY